MSPAHPFVAPRLHIAEAVHPSPRLPRIPIATYRLQFNSQFTFRHAQEVVPYLASLGVSDAYTSSYLKAVPGSTHGYDVADPTQLNPEIGSPEDYWAWIAALRAHDMGHLLDLVPNHMGIAKSANPWWTDVLENGPASRYASFFDITWRPLKDELADKVLIPILGDQYGAVLDRQELQLAYGDGTFRVCYFDDWFPVAPDTFPHLLLPTLDAWIGAEHDRPAPDDADELRSIITAAEHLPPRSASDANGVAIRAREKEIVKRRLATLVERCPVLGERITSTLAWFNGVAGEPRTFDPLDTLLGQQSYRLAHWRTASEEINYRRFFDVNQLAALRMEDPDVFDEVHRFAFTLLEQGAATGVRIDHVDGLFAPGDYLRRLQSRASTALGIGNASTSTPLYVVVEKILGSDEQLPPDWPVHGTTGYEFAAAVNGLFVDARNAQAIDRLYARLVGDRGGNRAFADLAYASKKRVMHETMSGDLNSLGYQLNRFSERNRHFRDFTLYSLIATIKEVIACFPVYRSYITDAGPLSEHDRRFVARAIRDAKRASPGLAALVFDFVERILLHEAGTGTPEEREERQRFIGKFQQITSPVAAKGIEDTALYVYNRLVSLNEVGSDPTVFGVEPDRLHQWMLDRRRRWPAGLSTTGTHDTKRGEDVRARINVISELPGEWKTAVRRWRALNRRLRAEVGGRSAPDANEEYLLYQTLVGAWPCAPADEPGFAARVKEYMRKALREAKVNTSWLTPDDEYEQAVLGFVDRILDPRRPFLDAFRPFQQRVAEIGMVNSLAQLVIKCTAPGVPDFYQGTELWDLALVDPDNRRPVDYPRRAALLRALHGDASAARAEQLLHARADGRIKLWVAARSLAVRRVLRDAFADGDYVPLAVIGAQARHLFAFARMHPTGVAVACVPRLVASLPGHGLAPPLGADAWDDTAIVLPESCGARRFTQAFTGITLTPVPGVQGVCLAAADLFAHLPVALLTADGINPTPEHG
jgi:(1->4)-alpha-D-glucan 1-alpha-D-glucosylmutase